VIISVVNQKGGVGKTTTTLNLGAALVAAGASVQLIDLDVTQRDLVTFAGATGLPVRACDAAELPILLDEVSARDFVLIDCPPALGADTAAALKNSDMAIVPLQPEGLAVKGLARILKTVDAARSMQRGGNVKLQSRLLITMLDSRDPAALAIDADVRSRYGDQVFERSVKRSPLFTQAALEKQSIFQYAPRCHGAAAYAAAAQQLQELNNAHP